MLFLSTIFSYRKIKKYRVLRSQTVFETLFLSQDLVELRSLLRRSWLGLLMAGSLRDDVLSSELYQGLELLPCWGFWSIALAECLLLELLAYVDLDFINMWSHFQKACRSGIGRPLIALAPSLEVWDVISLESFSHRDFWSTRRCQNFKYFLETKNKLFINTFTLRYGHPTFCLSGQNLLL